MRWQVGVGTRSRERRDDMRAEAMSVTQERWEKRRHESKSHLKSDRW